MKTKLKYNPIPKDIGDYVAYSEESSTGLVNKVARHGAKKGAEAGSIADGYFLFCFNYKIYRVHRVVYFLCTGIDPEEKQVDHIDGNRSNNKISNLRLATNRQNNTNIKKRKGNTSGVTGVYWRKTEKRYMAIITCNLKNIKLGGFVKFNEAVAVRIAAETDPRFKDQEFRHPHNDKYTPSPEMLEWAKQYLEDKIERLGWKEKYGIE